MAAKKAKDEEVKDIEAAEEAEVKEAPAKKASKESVTVSWRGMTREYSKEIHGDDFLELAESFAKKFNGTLA